MQLGFDPLARTPDMSIDVSLGEFHSTHDAAYAAEKLVKGGMAKLSTDQLSDALTKLCAGQRLTDAETGDDFMFASDYHDTINHVQLELIRRSAKEKIAR